MTSNKWSEIALTLVFATLVVLCVLLNRNTVSINEGNERGRRSEYQRVLLGCNTSGALETTDPYLRDLCDNYLPDLRRRLQES